MGAGPRLQAAREQIVERLLDFLLPLPRLRERFARQRRIGGLLGVMTVAFGLLPQLAGPLAQLLGPLVLTLGFLTLPSFIGLAAALFGPALGLSGFALAVVGRLLGGFRFLLRLLRASFQRGSTFLSGFLFQHLG